MDHCKYCGCLIAIARVDLGYRTCLPCGDREARSVVRTVVPMHKSNYMLVTDMTLLPQLTRPGRTLGG